MKMELQLRQTPGTQVVDDTINDRLRGVIHRVYRDTCQYCGASCGGNGHIDHIIPKSKGGENNLDNYILACPKCNHSKLRDYVRAKEREGER